MSLYPVPSEYLYKRKPYPMTQKLSMHPNSRKHKPVEDGDLERKYLCSLCRADIFVHDKGVSTLTNNDGGGRRCGVVTRNSATHV
jgi:hypothetical protein